MNSLLDRIKAVAATGAIRLSQHAVRELAADRIPVSDALKGIDTAVALEEYPEAFKGPSILVLQRDSTNAAIHLVWGISKGQTEPVVLITAYRPDPKQWSSDWTKRVVP